MKHTHFATLLAGALLPGAAAAQVPSVVRVEIDYMVGTNHDHMPSVEVLDAAVQVFACHGISLELVLSDPIPEVFSIECPLLSQSFWTCSGRDSFAELKATFADQGNALGWHYCIFGHLYDDGGVFGSSGYAEGHDDFIVTMGAFSDSTGTPFQQASTFIHELGHNLGLGHGSPASVDRDGPYAPNYASVMSYQYQLVGVKSGMEALGLVSSAHLFKDIDYSNGRLPGLDEEGLVEADGMGIRAFDWSCNGQIAGAPSKDLDGESDYCAQGADDSFLDDYDDWANIRDTTHVAAPLAPPGSGSQHCMSAQELEQMLAHWPAVPGTLATPGLGPPQVLLEPCKAGEMYFVDVGGSGSSGTGDAPFGSVTQALSVAPDHSVLYLQTGTYAAPGGLLVDRPMLFAGPGSAIIDP